MSRIVDIEPLLKKYDGMNEGTEFSPIHFINDLMSLEQQPCEDCRNCKKWNKCPCGKEGHENGTSIGYSIGECKDYEPCEDCISRAAAINTAIDAADDWDGGCDAYREKMIREALEALPPVTPERPKGKWIQTKDDCDGVNFYDFSFECSKCGKEQSFKSNYCPNCGAYMREGEER